MNHHLRSLISEALPDGCDETNIAGPFGTVTIRREQRHYLSGDEWHHQDGDRVSVTGRIAIAFCWDSDWDTDIPNGSPQVAELALAFMLNQHKRGQATARVEGFNADELE